MLGCCMHQLRLDFVTVTDNPQTLMTESHALYVLLALALIYVIFTSGPKGPSCMCCCMS